MISPIVFDDVDASDIDLAPLVLEALNELRNDDDRQLLARRLGVTDRAMTLQEIAEDRGVTPQRVQQLEARALTRIHTRIRQPESAARSLAAAVSYLADADAVLVTQLIDLADTWFGAPAVWLAKTVYRMVGRDTEDVELLAALVAQRLAERRNYRREEHRQRMRYERLDEYVDKWIADALWPARPDTSGYASESLSRRRMPDPDRGGSFYSQKLSRTVYFESGLEESVLLTAEQSSQVRSYQEQPCGIGYAGSDDNHVYYPDLLVVLADGRTLLMEIKPLPLMAVTENRIKSAAGQQFAATHGWGWVTVADRGRTFKDLRCHQLPPEVSAALSQALHQGPLRWPALKQLRQRTPFSSSMDLPAYAVQTNTALGTTPYRLG